MSSSRGNTERTDFFQNADPFHHDEALHPEAQHPPQSQFTQIPDTVDDDYRLTGVKSADPFADDRAKAASGDENAADTSVISSNPFASAESKPSEPAQATPGSAVSPGPDDHAEYFNRGGSGQAQGAAALPTITTEHVDHDIGTPGGQSPTAVRSEEASDALAPTNSNVNGDRAERGTDIYANADPPTRGRQSSEHSPDDSDSDSGMKIKESGGGRGVKFADSDEIEKEPTHEDTSDGVLDKVKTTLTKVRSKIHLDEVKAAGPFKRMNPTNVRMRVRFDDDPTKDVGIVWRSRDNRKGRNSVVVPRTSMAYPNLPPRNRPVYSSSFRGVGRNLYRMAFTFPYWDMAFWSGWSYTWGSVLFVIDGCWAWIPVGWPKTYIPDWIPNYASGIFFFIGALLYQLGAVIAWLESVNDGSFHGSAMKRFLEGHEEDKKKMLDEKVKNFFGHFNPIHEKHRHEKEEAELEKMKSVDPEAGWRSVPRRERMGSIFPAGQKPGPRRGGIDLGEAEEGETHEYVQWRWWPTWHAFRYHHIYEVGFVACSIQLFGATLYSWCGLVSLHGITEHYTTNADWYGGYWFPEIFGSCGFLSASVMFLLETQEAWYKPQPHVVGWWIGAFAFIGSMGFLLNGVFGVIYQATGAFWASYQSECSTTWGSFGYLLSALFQWYEAVNKHPVEEGYYDESGNFEHFQVHEISDMSGTVDL